MGRPQRFADWILDASEDLLEYADIFDGYDCTMQELTVPYTSGRHADTGFRIPKRSQNSAFNTPSGLAHRRSGFNRHAVPYTMPPWCELCRKEGGSGMHKLLQTKFRCAECLLPLCLTVPAMLRKHCFLHLSHIEYCCAAVPPAHILDVCT